MKALSIKVIQYGIPRSGSTLIWQILNYLFTDVTKTHNYINTKLPVFITYRDFRDTIMSYWRIYNLNKKLTSEKELIKTINNYNHHFDILEKYKSKNNTAWLKYELFYDNFNYIYDIIETLLNINIDDKEKDIIKNKFNVTNNLNISTQLKGHFDKTYDKITKLHANHIYNKGKINNWKLILDNKLHLKYTELLYDILKEWNYI